MKTIFKLNIQQECTDITKYIDLSSALFVGDMIILQNEDFPIPQDQYVIENHTFHLKVTQREFNLIDGCLFVYMDILNDPKISPINISFV